MEDGDDELIKRIKDSVAWVKVSREMEVFLRAKIFTITAGIS